MAEFDPFTHPEHIQKTARSQSIEKLQRYFDSKQYEGKADWWTGRKGGNGDERVPLRERKPCVIYELPKAAVGQVTRFLFGEGRFPQYKTSPTEGDGTIATVELSEDGAATVNAWLNEFTTRSRLKVLMRALAKRGIGMKTAVAIVSIEHGEFRIHSPRAQDCWAKFVNDDPQGEVERLVWSYEFNREDADSSGAPKQKRYRWRREWDSEFVTTYEPIEVRHGEAIKWGPGEQVAHKFSFCPVVWIPNHPDGADGDMDGEGLFEGLEDELDALNFSYSQRHRGIHYWGTPQPWQTGVEAGDGPGAEGRTATGTPGWSSAKPEHGAHEPAIKRAPEHVWEFEGEKVELGLLETSGKSFEVSSKHIDDIRSRLLEQMGVVLSSQADTTGRRDGVQMSARFLALAHAPLVALVTELREPWWGFGLYRILSMALRMTVELKGQGILVPGSVEVAELLKSHVLQLQTDTGTRTLWEPPRIEPIWGRFFTPSTQEIKEACEATAAAVKARILSRESGTRYIAGLYGVDGEEELERLLTEDGETPGLDEVELEEPDDTGDEEPEDESTEEED